MRSSCCTVVVTTGSAVLVILGCSCGVVFQSTVGPGALRVKSATFLHPTVAQLPRAARCVSFPTLVSSRAATSRMAVGSTVKDLEPEQHHSSNHISSALDWYPGCPESLGLRVPKEPDPNSRKSQKMAARKAMWRANKEKLRASKRAKAKEPLQTDKPQTLHPRRENATARATKRERAAEELEDFQRRCRGAPTLCVDCEWEAAMSKRQLSSFVWTLSRCYGSNRKAERPFNLMFSGVREGSTTEMLLNSIPGYQNYTPWVWPTSQPYIRLFEPSKLVYISPDGEELADTFEDPDTVYIIGGINDGNKLPGKSRLKADLQEIRTVRLPIPETLRLKGIQTILTVNQVLEILLKRRQGMDWHEALTSIMPGRKLYHIPAQATV